MTVIHAFKAEENAQVMELLAALGGLGYFDALRKQYISQLPDSLNPDDTIALQQMRSARVIQDQLAAMHVESCQLYNEQYSATDLFKTI